jgi:homoserine O-acetyltransferase
MTRLEQQSLNLNLEKALKLRKGGQLEDIVVSYQTHGELNKNKDNAILICHPLTMDANVSGERQGPKPDGWWNFLVGPGRPVDTNRFFVVCSNVLGGCQGTTGPISIDQKTGKPYKTSFPEVTIHDMVDVQKLFLDQLGVPELYAVVGGSLGGMQALEWTVRYPDYVKRCAAIATGSQLSSQGLAFDVVGRQCITKDPEWNGGDYDIDTGGAVPGLALARMIGHITYISKNIMDHKWGRKLQDGRSDEGFNTSFAVESFLQYNSEKFIKRFDPNAYLYISKAMDTYDLGDGFDSLDESLKRALCKFLVISFSSDWLFPPEDSIDLATSLARVNRSVHYANIDTDLGHDAFLIDAPEIQHMCHLVENFLSSEANEKV